MQDHTITWPTCLSVPDFDVCSTGCGLDMSEDLGKIIEVAMSCVLDILALPIRESVRKTRAQVNATLCTVIED